MDRQEQGGLEGPRAAVAAEVFARHPDYRAVVVYASGLRNGPSDERSAGLLREAEAAARARFGDGPVTEHPHIKAWRAAYAAFGSKPSRYRCSAEALLRRALGDGLPGINLLVDAYNAVSVAHLLPLGGEDRDRVDRGGVLLRFAAGGEPFEARDGGEPVTVGADPGEAIWVDAKGVTCRRWNWRQCERTALTEQSVNAYFLLDALDPFTDAELDAATAALTGHLELLSPGCDIAVETLRAAVAV